MDLSFEQFSKLSVFSFMITNIFFSQFKVIIDYILDFFLNFRICLKEDLQNRFAEGKWLINYWLVLMGLTV